MQRLRGRIYLHDGAISRSELSGDGRHILPGDDRSWHLLTVSDVGEVMGCTRFLQHGRNTRFADLRISHTALAQCELWGAKLRRAIDHDLHTAALANFSFVEVGGWAIAEKIRGTSECLRSVLAIYAWSRLAGGAIGISTATERNSSASILRRLGGHSLKTEHQDIPAYYEPRHRCTMHLLRYDSRRPAPRYERSVQALQKTMAGIPVILPDRPACQPLFSGFTAPVSEAVAA